MPVHDWGLVDAGTYHDFHNSWIIHLKEALNGGLLPTSYYALSEQHAGKMIADILTLHARETPETDAPDRGGVAVMDAPPRVSRHILPGPRAQYLLSRKTIAVRHASNDRIVALIEILSPANKDRAESVEDFVLKVHRALRAGVHVLLIDLFPPGKYDPEGMHGAIWEPFDSEEDYLPPPDKRLTQVSYLAKPLPEAFLEPLALGEPLTNMPLFLDGGHIEVPLESSYMAALQGIPAIRRGVLEQALLASRERQRPE